MVQGLQSESRAADVSLGVCGGQLCKRKCSELRLHGIASRVKGVGVAKDLAYIWFTAGSRFYYVVLEVKM